MDELILSYIKEIEERKKSSKVYPDHVMYIELIKHANKELNNSLNRLYGNKQIEVGRTLNDKWIKIL